MTDISNHYLQNSQLGKNTNYPTFYAPEVLFAIPRHMKRNELFGSKQAIVFYGFDIWNAYEISWLNMKGKPEVRIGELIYDANSPYMVESKSLKLYLNSFNNTKFKDEHAVIETVKADLEKSLQTGIKFSLFNVEDPCYQPSTIQGICLDNLDIDFEDNTDYQLNIQQQTQIKSLNEKIITEKVYTNLLKSNCLITNQPDFGTLVIEYTGPKLNHEYLMRYIVSLRNHNEFHEQCVERIFANISWQYKPHSLSVYARYTRRGGLDINPYRFLTPDFKVLNSRLSRQ